MDIRNLFNMESFNELMLIWTAYNMEDSLNVAFEFWANKTRTAEIKFFFRFFFYLDVSQCNFISWKTSFSFM